MGNNQPKKHFSSQKKANTFYIVQRDLIIRLIIVFAVIGTIIGIFTNPRLVFFESWSDENIHMYVANQVATGKSLYGEVHSARPPLAILPLAGLLYSGFPPLAAARIVVIIAILATTFLLFFAGSRLWGGLAGLLASIFYMLSPAVVSRHSFTGINLVSFWTTLCVVAVVIRRPIFAGISAGVALATGQHSIIIVALSAVIAFLHGRKSIIRFTICCISTVMFILAVAYAVGGNGIYTDLIGNHLYHFHASASPKAAKIGWWMTSWIFDNVIVFLFAICAIILEHKRNKTVNPPRKFWNNPIYQLGCIAVVHIATIAFMGGGLILYVHPAFPLLALLSGAGVQHLAEHLNRQKGKTALLSVAIIGSILIVVTVTAWHVSSFRFSKRDQQEYSIFPHVRYFQMARLQRPIVADKISSYIEMASDYKSKIFGHPTITTLVALKSERHIACEFADLDPAWIKMGIISRESIVECIEKDNVQFYISPAWFLIIDPYFKKYLQQCYKPPIIFPREPGSGIPRIFVFKHLEGPTPCIPDVLAKKTDEKYSCP